jgi:glycerate-2-kinase
MTPSETDASDGNDADGVRRVDASDPRTEAILAVARELRALRYQLAADTDNTDGSSEESGTSRTCRSCQVTFDSESDARRHAMDDHGAPSDDWRTLYTQP